MVSRGNWRFAPGAAALFPDGDPERLMAGAEIVKDNPVRRVLRAGNCFVKIDRRAGRDFDREFAHGRRLAELGLPVVEHLASGFLSTGEAALVTRALDGACDARSFFARTHGDCVGAGALARLVSRMWESGMFHGDCHLGNFLYAPGKTEPVLVDVDAVRRRHWFDSFRRGRMLRVVTELRLWFPRAGLEELLAVAGADEPERFLAGSLRREAALLRHEWARRRRQILAGYAKFTRSSGGTLLAAGVAEHELARLPAVTGGATELTGMFLAHFFLMLAEIPHIGAAALDRDGGKLYLDLRPTGNPLPEDELEYRLRVCGVAVSPAGRSGGFVNDLAAVSAPPWLWE